MIYYFHHVVRASENPEGLAIRASSLDEARFIAARLLPEYMERRWHNVKQGRMTQKQVALSYISTIFGYTPEPVDLLQMMLNPTTERCLDTIGYMHITIPQGE